MLNSLQYEKTIIERVCFLVAHHHTYSNIDGIDYQILVEADFLVNLYEENVSKNAVDSAYNRVFKTETGRRLCRTMFGMTQ